MPYRDRRQIQMDFAGSLEQQTFDLVIAVDGAGNRKIPGSDSGCCGGRL